MSVLIMVTAEGFYPIDAVPEVSMDQQARDHGLLNDHITRVIGLNGEVLWDRKDERNRPH
jgi:hypothetical protein